MPISRCPCREGSCDSEDGELVPGTVASVPIEQVERGYAFRLATPRKTVSRA